MLPKGSHRNGKPTHCKKQLPVAITAEKLVQQQGSSTAKNKYIKLYIYTYKRVGIGACLAGDAPKQAVGTRSLFAVYEEFRLELFVYPRWC